MKKVLINNKEYTVSENQGDVWIEDSETKELRRIDLYDKFADDEDTLLGDPSKVVSPVTGVIKELKFTSGANVIEGNVICTIESMKTFFEIKCKKTGILSDSSLNVGDQVLKNTVLFSIL